MGLNKRESKMEEDGGMGRVRNDREGGIGSDSRGRRLTDTPRKTPVKITQPLKADATPSATFTLAYVGLP